VDCCIKKGAPSDSLGSKIVCPLQDHTPPISLNTPASVCVMASQLLGQVQCSCMFCLSVLQGNKEALAIEVGKELVKHSNQEMLHQLINWTGISDSRIDHSWNFSWKDD